MNQADSEEAGRGERADTSLTPHIPALDGLRGVAALMVMFYHFALDSGYRGGTALDQTFSSILLVCWSGVDLFFVLSGFLITGILWDARGGAGYFRNFYARRALRIIPVYYLSLLLVLYVLPLGAEVANLRSDQWWYWSFLLNFRIAFVDWPEPGLLGHYWTLAVEEQFYLLWPVLVLLCHRRGLMWFCGACMIAAPLFRLLLVEAGQSDAAWVLMPARMDSLAAGALLALWIRAPAGLQGVLRWLKPGLAVTLVGLVLLGWWVADKPRLGPVVLVAGFSLLALLFMWVILAVLRPRQGSVWVRVLETGLLCRAGQLSYAMYLFHHPISMELAAAGLNVNALPRLAGSPLPGYLLFVLVAGAMTIGLAWLSWTLVERPALKLKRHFPYHRGPGSTSE